MFLARFPFLDQYPDFFIGPFAGSIGCIINEAGDYLTTSYSTRGIGLFLLLCRPRPPTMAPGLHFPCHHNSVMILGEKMDVTRSLWRWGFDPRSPSHPGEPACAPDMGEINYNCLKIKLWHFATHSSCIQSKFSNPPRKSFSLLPDPFYYQPKIEFKSLPQPSPTIL